MSKYARLLFVKLNWTEVNWSELCYMLYICGWGIDLYLYLCNVHSLDMYQAGVIDLLR